MLSLILPIFVCNLSTRHSYVDLSIQSITLILVQLIINPKLNQIAKKMPKCTVIFAEFSI